MTRIPMVKKNNLQPVIKLRMHLQHLHSYLDLITIYNDQPYFFLITCKVKIIMNHGCYHSAITITQIGIGRVNVFWTFVFMVFIKIVGKVNEATHDYL